MCREYKAQSLAEGFFLEFTWGMAHIDDQTQKLGGHRLLNRSELAYRSDKHDW